MKYSTLLFSCFLLLFLNTSCEKAGKIHLISAHTWVVTEVSNFSNFALVGDELTFHDNRLFFNNSNGVETDGQWEFDLAGTGSGPTTSYSVSGLFVTAGFGSYEFSINKLTANELELVDYFPGISGTTTTIRLKPKE